MLTRPPHIQGYLRYGETRPVAIECVTRDLLAWFSSPLLPVLSPAHKLSVANIINIPTFGYSVSVHHVVSTSYYCEAVVPRPYCNGNVTSRVVTQRDNISFNIRHRSGIRPFRQYTRGRSVLWGTCPIFRSKRQQARSGQEVPANKSS